MTKVIIGPERKSKRTLERTIKKELNYGNPIYIKSLNNEESLGFFVGYEKGEVLYGSNRKNYEHELSVTGQTNSIYLDNIFLLKKPHI